MRAKCTGKRGGHEDSDSVASDPSNLEAILASEAFEHNTGETMALRTAVLRPLISRQWLAAAAASPSSSARHKSRMRVPSSSRFLGTSVSVSAKHKMPDILPEEEKFIVRSPYSEVEVPEVNLTDFVFRDVKEWEDNIALVSQQMIQELIEVMSSLTPSCSH